MIIDTKAVNTDPVIDPVGAVVCAADISNVRTVLVDGRVVKDDFKLAADLDGPRRGGVEASRDYLVGEFGEPEPAGWSGNLPRRLPPLELPLNGAAPHAARLLASLRAAYAAAD